MRVAHVTDIHVMLPPRPRQLLGKRLLGTANLYLGGRKSHFTRAAQEALVAAVTAQAPDAVVCTGDLTAQGTPEEFEAARALLGPLFSAQPSVVIPGNHDTYTRDAVSSGALEHFFGEWIGSGPWPRLHLVGDDLAVVALQVCEPRLDSAGRVPDDQLARIGDVLTDASIGDRALFVALHYPLRGRRGEPYGPATRALDGARRLEGALGPHAGSIAAILHGHEHHGYRTSVDLGDVSVPILNPGAGGYAHLPAKRRTAHFTVYEVGRDGLGAIERFAFDGERFEPEAGGAWATGG